MPILSAAGWLTTTLSDARCVVCGLYAFWWALLRLFVTCISAWVQEEAESGCEVDYSTGSRSGPDCAKLESFESFVRQLVGQAPMSSFAHMLYTLRNAELHEQEERREEQQRKPALGT